MAGQGNAAPVIIKRKKVIVGGGHHGGAWKVAYADFVTAMMAFFMLMWLLNATTEKQRKGIADYFNPTIPINRISGGGDGAFGGNSIFSEDVLTQSGTGASLQRATSDRQAKGVNLPAGDASDAGSRSQEALDTVEKVLLARGGESMTMQRILRHVVTRVTDEGLVIEIFDLPDAALFAADTAEPEPVLDQISALLAEVLGLATNQIAVQGHVRSYPVPLIDNPAWGLSSSRAQMLRTRIEAAGLPSVRMERVAGYADRRPATADPTAARNNRIEVILLRDDR
jgi:chemotaxis protein MotB